MPKDLVTDKNLNDAAFEKKALVGLRKKAYEVAYDAAAADIEAAPEVSRKVPEIEKRLANVEAAGKNITVKTELVPARPMEVENIPTMLDVVSLGVTAEFLRRVSHDKIGTIMARLKSGSENATLRRTASKFLKAATDTSTTTSAGWAAELVQSNNSGFWFDTENVSIFAQLARLGTTLEFGNANSLTIPRIADASDMKPSWISENSTIPVLNGTLGSASFNRHKLAGISVFTDELAKTSVPNIVAVIEREIKQNTTEAIDEFLLDGVAAVAGLRPASILNSATTQASAGDTLANIVTDLKWLISKLSGVKAVNPVLIMNPLRIIGLSMITNDSGVFVFRDEIAGGTIFNIQLVVSHNCPEEKVVAMDASVFAAAVDTPIIDMSNAANIVMVNADGVAPSMDGTVAGSVKVSDAGGTTPPSQVHSLFQMSSQALRLINPVTWGLIAPRVSYLTSVAW